MKQRDEQLDGIRGFLIFLVVLGHLLEIAIKNGCGESGLVYHVYFLIYTFHMPVMIFLSGYFSKKDTAPEKLVRTLLVPYILFNFIFWLWYSRKPDTLLVSRLAMWYMLSLFFWRLLIRPVASIRYAWIFVLVLSLYIGILESDGDFLNMKRLLSFFPYFVSGYLLSSSQLDQIRGTSKIVSCLMVLALVFAAKLMIGKGIPAEFLMMKESYGHYWLSDKNGMIFRLGCLMMGYAFTGCLISLFPRKTRLFSWMGKRTVTIYFFHVFVIKLAEMMVKKTGYVFHNELLVLGAFGILALAVCILFGSDIVQNIYKKTMSAVNSVLMRRTAGQGSDNIA